MTETKELGLSPSWRRWIADALEHGGDAAEMVVALAQEGVPEAIAVREIGVIRDALAVALRNKQRMEMVLRVLSVNAAGYLERRPVCTPKELYERYFSTLRPVVFSDGCADMAAASWTFEGLRGRFGGVEVQVGVTDAQSMTLASAIDGMLAPGASPNLYIVSRSKVLAGPLRELASELSPLPGFLDGERARQTANLWMGPKGTFTPLHHDTTHVYFCQIAGEKRYELVAPWETEVLEADIESTYDSTFDIDHPQGVRVHDVVLGPGEALFIPIGWWHRVTAVSPSISVSMRGFVWPSDQTWYHPGATPIG